MTPRALWRWTLVRQPAALRTCFCKMALRMCIPSTLGVMDVSFISITKILPAAAKIMGEDGAFISLIKPQFEAGRDRVGKKGVVRDAQVHRDVICEVLGFIENDLGWAVQALSFSPIRGPEGNIEFLVHILPKAKATHHVTQEEIDEVVAAAHDSLRD